MYAEAFGLCELPFNNTPDPRFFYSTPDHEEALASLIYAVQERKGFVLLTGEVGTGKTLISRMMIRHFGTQISFATINHGLGDGNDLLESVCTEFELEFQAGASQTQLVHVLHDFLLQQFARNMPVVLVLDEAQNLPIDAFEQLRMIGNLEADDAKLLQIVIVGQPELQQKFQSPRLRQLKQRIFRSFHLPAMSREAVEGYIRHRLEVAGGTDYGLFDDDVIDRVYALSDGLPRLINTLCDNAMLTAYSAGKQRITLGLFESAANATVVNVDRASASPVNATVPPPGTHASSYRPRPAAGGVAACAEDGGITDELRHRLAMLESRVCGQEATAPPAYGYGMPNPGMAAVDRFEQRLMAVEHGWRSSVDSLSQRLAELDRRLSEGGTWAGMASEKKQQLAEMFDDSSETMRQARRLAQDIQQREAGLRKLSATFRAVSSEVSRLVADVQRATRSANEAKSGADKSVERLSTQCARAGELKGHLSTLIERALEAALSPSAGTITKQRSAPVGKVVPPGRGATDRPRSKAKLRTALSHTSQTLTDLRNLADSVGRRNALDASNDDDQDVLCEVESPTNRLAEEVDSLLAMVTTCNR